MADSEQKFFPKGRVSMGQGDLIDVTGPVVVAIRPEHILIDGGSAGSNRFSGEITRTE